ncbi:MAG: hypothetical protein JWL91_825 [Sphingomonas bacterium]|nr:hypothetical protein [Sphingomonas bacterium]MDB5688949.1 hypothetical protein [Sphingomonas bacterium]
MLPIRTRSIFRSRWMALLWAGGIVWSAVEFADGQKDEADENANLSAADQQAIADAVKALGQ